MNGLACYNGNHSNCATKTCSCACHKPSPRGYSGACADGDHSDCRMSHGTGSDDCRCPVGSHR